jgi:hypothetical protein
MALPFSLITPTLAKGMGDKPVSFEPPLARLFVISTEGTNPMQSIVSSEARDPDGMTRSLPCSG